MIKDCISLFFLRDQMHKKSKRRHGERSHRRRGHKCHHRSWDSSSSTDYSPRYKRRRSYSPGKTSDE
uniref:Uncharacterized protein n=1 Tax=Trichogramma kaykai TaxID=54128 RepID=A0ABD2WIX0_9HYME